MSARSARSASCALISCRHTRSARWRASHRGKPLASAERMPLRLSVIMRNIRRILSEKSGAGASLWGRSSCVAGQWCSFASRCWGSLLQRRRSACTSASTQGAGSITRKCRLRSACAETRRNTAVIPLSPAQEQGREAERRKKNEDEERSKEDRRKNLALLNTYSSERDIEDARTRALKEAQVVIEDTEKS